MECIIELNSLCKHIKQVRSSQPTILYTKLKKTQFFPVSIVNGIYSHREISEESKAHIEASQNVLSKKRFIKEGKERKERILEKLFVKKKENLFISKCLLLIPSINEKICENIPTSRASRFQNTQGTTRHF